MMIPESNSQSSKLTTEIFDALWKILDSIRGISDISEFKDLVLTFLFLKYISDLDLNRSENQSSIIRLKLPKNSSFYAIHAQRYELHLVEIVEQALRAFEEANPELYGIFDNIRLYLKNIWRRGEDNRYALRGIIEVFAQPQLNFRSSEINPKLAGQLFSFLIDRFSRNEGFRGGEYYTPQGILPLIVRLLYPKSGSSLYDPAVGTGGMLIAGSQFVKEQEGDDRRLALFGQDIVQETALLAKMNLFLHQTFDAEIAHGDSLRAPRFMQNEKLQRFD